jgi:serine/threonine protein kinase
MSRLPKNINTSNHNFKYSTLDPQTPVEIEEYSDLYDDYMNSPASQGSLDAETMNSGAAIYEQFAPSSSHEHLNSHLNRQQTVASDDSIDSSFVNNSEMSLKTPQFAYNSRFESPRTPNSAFIKTPVLNSSNIFDSSNQQQKQLQQNSINLKNLNITSAKNSTRSFYNDLYSPTTQYHQHQFESPNGSAITDDDDNDDLYYTNGEHDAHSLNAYNNTDINITNNEYAIEGGEEEEEEEEEVEDDGDGDDDYDDSEVERLRLQAQIKNQQIYASYKSSNDINNYLSNTNDATIVTKTLGKTLKIDRKGIKDFQLGRELGEGSYSTVILGTDKSNGKKYAIKILNKRHIIKEKKVKYVNIEKNALNRLGSRNGIVGLHFTFQDAQSLYFVLDFAENGELLTLIKKFGTMNANCTRYYTIQLVDAINYMHINGIVHRDLKPENVLIGKDMKLQITDFGTAKLMDKDDLGNYPNDIRANSFVGTAEYVSPELLNDKYCGKAADIWALGCIIYQMIAGKPPFKATNEYLTFQKIQKLQYAFTAGFPIIIRDLIKRILLIKPRERLTIPDIKRHLWFQDIDWNNEDQIWNHPPPELGPYKMSAKAMKHMPELDTQYPNGSSTSILRMKKSKSTNVFNNGNDSSHSKKPVEPKKRAVSTNSAPSSASTAIAASSANLPVLASSKLTSKSSAQSTSRPNSSTPKKKRSASSAAAVALYGNSTMPNSSPVTLPPPKPTAVEAVTPPIMETNMRSGSPYTNTVPIQAHSPLYPPVSSIDVQQVTADRVIQARQIKTKESQLQQKQKQKQNISKSGIVPDLIPGTNIPRPVLNTKIASRSGTGLKSRNNSSLKTHKKNEIPQLSVLDLKWVEFIKHPDERILKVGIVDATREKTAVFEKKYKGMMIESPLGYKSKDTIDEPKLFSNNDEESITLLDVSITVADIENSNKNSNANEDNDSEEENDSSVNKFRKFFTVKQPVQQVFENKPVTRTMLITTFGRVLLFRENYGTSSKMKYEMTTEIDLTNSLIHFVEVFPDRKGNLNKGLFAVVSKSITICFEVDKTEVTQWTQCLLTSRLLEKERRLKESINFPISGEGLSAEGEEAAFTAAIIASHNNPDLPTTLSYTHTHNKSSNKTPFLSTLRSQSDDGNNSGAQNSSKASSSSSPQQRQQQEQDKSTSRLNRKPVPKSQSSSSKELKKKKSIGKGPMITAAINKAVSMATVNSGVGIKDDDKKITQMNSKFLARSRFR